MHGLEAKHGFHATGGLTSMSVFPATTGSIRRVAWAAIASGVLAIIAFGSLIAYFATTPKEILDSQVAVEPGALPLMSRVLITSNSLEVMLQHLFLIPVAVALHAFGLQSSPKLSRAAVTVGIIGLCGVALLELLPLINPKISDIFFMGPTGFVGVWLIAINWLIAGVFSIGLRIVGAVAGLGSVIVGASFFVLAPGLLVLAEHPFAYGNDSDFHSGIAIGGALGILFPIWAILLGRSLLRAAPRHVV
jgi:hypothetical protein